MKKTISIAILVLAFVGGLFLLYRNKPVSTAIQNIQTSNKEQGWETKTDEQANVTIVVKPLDLTPQATESKFNVDMSTHSVELDQDMTKIVVLIDDQGKEYKPISWEGPVGGHHREGVLTFSRITPAPKSVSLKIIGIGGVDRNFSWQL